MANWINIFEVLYPVGSIYFSTTSISPANSIGGTWVEITNAVIRGSNLTGYSGSDTHTITLEEIPAHAHNIALNIQHGDGEWVSGEALTSNLTVGGQRRYFDGTNGSGGGAAMSVLPRVYNCFIWYRTA